MQESRRHPRSGQHQGENVSRKACEHVEEDPGLLEVWRRQPLGVWMFPSSLNTLVRGRNTFSNLLIVFSDTVDRLKAAVLPGLVDLRGWARSPDAPVCFAQSASLQYRVNDTTCRLCQTMSRRDSLRGNRRSFFHATTSEMEGERKFCKRCGRDDERCQSADPQLELILQHPMFPNPGKWDFTCNF